MIDKSELGTDMILAAEIGYWAECEMKEGNLVIHGDDDGTDTKWPVTISPEQIGTNPWVEVDGEPIDWEATWVPNVRTSDCDQCGLILDGVIEGMDTSEGVCRCDQCKVYEGDFEAAEALAVLVGGIAKCTPETEEV